MVLADFNLVARAAEFVAIVGRSGCGKSTFLRLLAGLDTPDSGLIGFGADGRARVPGDVRVMFQEPRLLPWQSVLDNVIIGLGDGVPRPEAEERARWALAAVGSATGRASGPPFSPAGRSSAWPWRAHL